MTLSDLTPPTTDAAAALRAALGERVLLPDDPGYAAASTPWNLAVSQHPVAVTLPETAEDVVDVVRAARAAGLRVAPQSTGHAAGAIDPGEMSCTVLVSLARLRGVVVDADARTARVLGGSLWNDVLAETAPHGLTALHGSAGDVSVVGYSLSGGLSFYARARGLAVNTVRAVQIVTADGALRRASADENVDLFWAVRGGSGAYGIVVSVEIDLLAIPDVYAGMLLWPAERASEVAHTWAAWTASAPETATTSLRVLTFPPLPELPPFLSGRSVVVVDGAIDDTDEAAAELLSSLRTLGPEMDTFGRIPSAQLVAVHMDPPAPTPAVTTHAILDALPREAVDAFVAAASTPGLFVQEMRHVGGAAARRPEHAGAVGAVTGDYLAHAIAMVPVPQAAGAAQAAVQTAVEALSPWRTDAVAVTFIDTPNADPASVFGDAGKRLRALKAQFDPSDLFLAAHPV